MRTFKDTRGRCWYDIMPLEKSQVDIQLNYPGTIRGFHYHERHDDWFFLVAGNIKLVLTHPDEIIYMTQGDLIEIKAGRWHGHQTLGGEPSIIMEYATEKHNLKNPDDKREPYDTYDDWEIEKK